MCIVITDFMQEFINPSQTFRYALPASLQIFECHPYTLLLVRGSSREYMFHMQSGQLPSEGISTLTFRQSKRQAKRSEGMSILTFRPLAKPKDPKLEKKIQNKWDMCSFCQTKWDQTKWDQTKWDDTSTRTPLVVKTQKSHYEYKSVPTYSCS